MYMILERYIGYWKQKSRLETKEYMGKILWELKHLARRQLYDNGESIRSFDWECVTVKVKVYDQTYLFIGYHKAKTSFSDWKHTVIAFNEYKGAILDARVFLMIYDHFKGQFQIKVGLISQLG